MGTFSDGLLPGAFRKRSNRWLGEASEALRPLLRVTARRLARASPAPPAAWRNGLILAHSHFGDVLYRTCSLGYLSQFLPQCRWTFLTTPASAEILKGNPALADVVPWVAGENSWQLTRGAFARLRTRSFDVALCTNTLRHYPDLVLSVALGIPNRVGFTHKGLSGLITHPIPIDYPSSYPAYFRSLVANLTGEVPDWPLLPRVFSNEADRAAAADIWSGFAFASRRPVVACSVTSRQTTGSWPRSTVLAILREARRKADFEIVLCGGPGDERVLRIAAAELEVPCHILAGELGIRAYAAFLGKCAALLTLDSGPRHIGNAAGIPVLFMRNLSQLRVETGAYCSTETDLAPDMEQLSDTEIQAVALTFSARDAAQTLLSKVSASGLRA